MTTIADNPLLAPWTGPFGGVPPWDLVDPEAFLAAFDVAVEENKREIDAIAADPEPATVANTIEALERSGSMLERLAAVFYVHTSNLNVGPIPDIQREVGPKLAAFSDWVTQHAGLFGKVREVYQQLEEAPETGDGSVDPATRRLVTDRYRQFIRQGAELDADHSARLSTINQELAGLYTDFAQNVLHDEAKQVTWITEESMLDGLPADLVDGMRSAAAERGRPEAWAVLNTRSYMDPVLTNATDRALREQVWRTYYSRGDNPGDHDNKPIVTRILALRAERATLLGYPTHAHWRLEVAMAKTPEAATGLMMDVWPKARERAAQEVADMQAIADGEAADGGPSITIEPWDYRYYAEKVRLAHYDLDFGDVKPYLQLQKLVEAMLWCSGELYGLRYRPIEAAENVPVFHPDVRVWEVTGLDGQHVGLWYLDPYAREGKLSGAWMTAYRDQENMGEPISTLVSNNSNFVKGPEGEPLLISWDDARTLFHEFGHALHGLLSNVRFPSQSGTSVARDYVEFPSQINEHWLATDEVLNQFCRHHQTDEPMPADLIERIKRAETFNQGFDTVEYLASAIVDMRLHLAGDVAIDPDRFERETLADLGMPPQIVMRHRTPQFAHVFSGDGYSAGYYSYLWADALTADAAEAFEEADGYYDRSVAERLRAHVFSVGDTVDPADGFRAFRGRDVDTDALLRKRGFPVG
ncbi:MAG: M3 family metallopeptidase [Actinomycetota bacterium]